MKRKIIEIDENACNGCGECVSACHEGAIQLVNGKAKLISDIYCDGLGNCIGECPTNAIKIIERDAEEFNEIAVKEKMAQSKKNTHTHECGCPGMKVMSFKKNESKSSSSEDVPSELSQWPIQLHLVPINAPYWSGESLLVAADCTAFSLGNFHGRFLKDKKLIIACPKLDDTDNYVDKLSAILASNNIKDVTVLFMEVPCCKGLVSIVKEAIAKCGKNFNANLVEISLDGRVK